MSAMKFCLLVCFVTLLTACGGDDGNSGGISFRGTASLSWNPINDPTVVSYTVHYGKQSAGNFGLCKYEKSVDVPQPPPMTQPSVMIEGLELNTVYYFAVSVSTSDGRKSMCSNEVSKTT